MRAMILAAGEGTRLRPLTLDTPKVLLTVGGVPLIKWTLSWLRSYGIYQVAINLHYLGKKISDFLGDGSSLGMKIVYSSEEVILGTAGGVKRMEHFFDSTFVVVYGDVLTNLDLGAMLKYHETKHSLATIAVLEIANPQDVGVVSINEQGRILKFVEKPARGSGDGNMVNGGIYILERQILDYIPGEGYSDFAYDIFPRLIDLGVPVYGYILNPEDYLLDIGDKNRYRQAEEDLRIGKLKFHKASVAGMSEGGNRV